MIDPEQRATIAFLTARLEQHGPVESVITHVSHLLLGSERVYKLKRPVSYNYLDFSRPEQRLSACEAELRLNRRTASTLYLGVHRVTGGAQGFELDGTGPLVDAYVEMRRFERGSLLESIAQRGMLTRELLSQLAQSVAALHRKAEVCRGSGTARFGQVLGINEEAFATTGLWEDPVGHELIAACRKEFARNEKLLEARAADGKVRHGHGDLILRNICVIGGSPVLFDCLEFDPALATTDVLYDLAFLLMDLWHRGLRDEASWLWNRYVDEADESDGLSLLPLFMAVRAMVRAHVAEALAQSGGDRGAHVEAGAYLATAKDLLRTRPQQCIAVGGFSGSGKSTLSAALASHLGRPPGARVLSSDRIRKEQFGVPASESLPQEAYAPAVSQKVYETMLTRAEMLLRQGSSVVLDAVFDRDRSWAEV